MADREIAAIADRVGLEREALDRRLRGYSRGMLQRIGLAQALLRDPELLFLDEPASGTDPRGVALVRERILEAKARGATIVLNSHQLPEVEKVCDRIVFIDQGRLTKSETLKGASATRRRGLVRVPASRVVEAASVLSAEAVGADAEGDGTLRFAVGSDDDMARAIRALALAGIPVYEARVSAELEELFETKP
jgi:ABC-2 type transport system ATP-binding protein